MQPTKFLATAAIGLALATTGARAANLIQNGGFETGDLTGWTTDDPSQFDIASQIYVVGNPIFLAEAGSYSYEISFASLSQTFTDVAGEQYHVSLWINGNASDANPFANSSEFFAAINGVKGVDLSPVPVAVPTPGHPNNDYTRYGFSFVGTGSDTLDINASGVTNGSVFLDNVSVTAGVPEPSAWVMMIVGVGAVGAAARVARRQRVAITAL